jgi:HAD superfamily hydrolase (TIGR01509 family)
MIRWVFLDLGGVLLDESEYHAYMFREVRELIAARGVALTEDAFADGVREVVSGDSPSFGFDLPFHFLRDRGAAEAIAGEFEERVRGKDAALNRLRPDAVDVVEALHEKFSLGVVANQRPTMASFLDESGLSRWFEVVVISGVEGVGKPDPAIYRLALERAFCDPREAVMVGDRVDNDVVPAKALGMWTIRLRDGTWASQVSRTEAESPDREIGRLAELPDAVDALACRAGKS